MRQVYTIGETVFDIIFRDGQPVAARPGGAMLNTSVSLGRAGIPVHFISETGMDNVGDLVHHFLEENGVSTSFLLRYPGSKTALALAFLNSNRDADYAFYKDFPRERLEMDFPVVKEGDMVLFGSFFAVTPEVREKLIRFIRLARESRALILYDPNFRKPHLPELPQLLPLIRENIALSSLVRGSDEDFLNIFACNSALEAYGLVKNPDSGMGDGPDNPRVYDRGEKRDVKRILIYTRNRSGVEVVGDGFHLSVPVPEIVPVSTIGAGDAFNAGLICYCMKHDITPDRLSEMDVRDCENMVDMAIRFASDVCLHYDNYITPGLINVSEIC